MSDLPEGVRPEEVLPAAEVLARIASLAESLCDHPEVGEQVTELLDWVDAFHHDGLERLVDMIRAWRGEIFLEAVTADGLAGTLLEAYDLAGPERPEPTPTVIPLPARRSTRPAPLLQLPGHEGS